MPSHEKWGFSTAKCVIFDLGTFFAKKIPFQFDFLSIIEPCGISFKLPLRILKTAEQGIELILLFILENNRI